MSTKSKKNILAQVVAGLTTRIKALELDVKAQLARESAICTRLRDAEQGYTFLKDRLYRPETGRAECLDPSPGMTGVTDLRGRPIWWSAHARNPLRITDMTDSHLESAIAYLRRGQGTPGPHERTLYLEALAFEQGRRFVFGKKG